MSVVVNKPRHIAVIMDGNGRWAKKRLLTRGAGHKAGAAALDKLCEKMNATGYEFLTVYAFSTENKKRSADEVAGLMDLLRQYLRRYADKIKKKDNNNMILRVIGDLEWLDSDIRDDIAFLKDATKNNTGLTVTFAVNYGGRDEITRAVKKIAEDARVGKIAPDDVTEEFISGRLDTIGLPDPDLVIRTSGEIRLSNFLPWQTAYSELYFCEKLWPDFTFEDLTAAVEEFNGRARRFGA